MKLLTIFALLFATAAHAQFGWSDQQLLDKLKAGGYNIFFRHSITDGADPKQNPTNETVNDCSSQRPLNEFGRDQSRKIGKIFTENQIPIGKVYSSPICRCQETAKLAFGQYVTVDWLLVSNGLQPQHTLDNYLRELPKAGTNNIFIGHATTFAKNLLGKQWQKIHLAEGEAIIIKPEFPVIVGRIKF